MFKGIAISRSVCLQYLVDIQMDAEGSIFRELRLRVGDRLRRPWATSQSSVSRQ